MSGDALQALLEGLEPALRAKTERLITSLKDCGALIVGFSGGVDSGLLCALGHLASGSRFLAVTVQSPVESPGDSDYAARLAGQVGFRHILLPYDDLQNPRFVENPPDRCYHCKFARFQTLQNVAADGQFGEEFRAAVIAEGSNADDRSDYRPGARAVAELGIRSPLQDAGLTKAEVRTLARALNLLVWDRPSSPCLATRFPYGSPVTREGLDQISRGESFLQQYDFHPVRVRHDGLLARIEVAPDQIERLVALRTEILEYFKSIGFTYVLVDLAGYRMGSLNEVLAA